MDDGEARRRRRTEEQGARKTAVDEGMEAEGRGPEDVLENNHGGHQNRAGQHQHMVRIC